MKTNEDRFVRIEKTAFMNQIARINPLVFENGTVKVHTLLNNDLPCQ